MLKLVRTTEAPYVPSQYVAAVLRALYSSRWSNEATHIDDMSRAIDVLPIDAIEARNALVIKRANYAHAIMRCVARDTPDSLIRNALNTVTRAR
jgi:hypothetical protein